MIDNHTYLVHDGRCRIGALSHQHGELNVPSYFHVVVVEEWDRGMTKFSVYQEAVLTPLTVDISMIEDIKDAQAHL